MAIDLIIENGKVVTTEGVAEADVAIDKGKVVGIGGKGIFPEAERKIDARGKLVLPGAIDPHTHFEITFMGVSPEETWEMGTKAAAIGGTTTIINFTIQQKGRPLMEAIKADIEHLNKLAVVDVALHGCFTDFSDVDAVVNEIPALFDAGVPSIKEFMIYRHEGWMVDDWALYNVLEKIREYNGFVGIHAENAYIGEGLRNKFTAEGKTEPKYHPISKPNFVEAEAIQRGCSIADFARANLYIAHMSTKEGVQIVGGYRSKGVPIFSETCTHYLIFKEGVHADPEMGIYSQMSPPLRKQEDIDALWGGLANGTVSFIGSDHVPFNKASKEAGYKRNGFITIPNGVPGVLERLPVVYSEGVRKNRISLPRMVEVTSTNAAKMFGLYPRKGTIAPGSDADIVIFDPEKKETLGAHFYEGVDWSIFEGIEVTGFPAITLLKGKVIVEDKKFLGKAGDGQFVKGKVDENVAKSIT